MASAVPSSLISKLRNLKVRTDGELENCNFCGRPIPADHRHMIDVSTRRFMCTCEICVITQSARGHYKIIPQRYQQLKDLFLSEELWSEFMIPVNIAFFVFNSF